MTILERSGEERKQMGLDLVSDHNPDFLKIVRNRANLMCRLNGSVSSDELRAWADEVGVFPKHPNAWGAVFRHGFRRIEMRPSFRPSAHHRLVSVWALSCLGGS